MGISGLLPFLKKSSVNTNVRQFKGKTVAIDAYCWLHKGAFSCAEKIVKGEKTDAYVTYCMKFINMLLSNDIKPILVFDGQPLPSKLGTEIKRRENRERNKIQAREYLRQGNKSKARECFQKCVDVTSSMALDLIKACRARNIDCIVAPYEADAQLAYLALQGIAHLIITEDSDLLAFGCPRVFFKMDQNGSGVLIEKDKLYLSLGGQMDFFNEEKFRRMCILSGCDYLPSLTGIGLGKAFKFFSGNTNGDLNSVLCQVPGVLKMPSLEVTLEYRESFIKAEQTFLYQLAYNPIDRKLVPLHPYPPNVDSTCFPFAGQYLKDDVAFELAIGNLDAETLERLDNYNPDTAPKRSSSFLTKHDSVWSKEYKIQRITTSSIEQETQQVTSGVCKQITAKIEYCLPKVAEQVPIISDSELASQYVKKDSPTSPILAARKRKRSSENVSPTLNKNRRSAETVPNSDSISQNTSVPAVLDPFAEPIMSVISPVSKRTDSTPLRNANPFVKLKTPSSDTKRSPQTPPVSSPFSALQTFTQLKRIDVNGQHVVTSTYFQTDDTTAKEQCKKSVLNFDSHSPNQPILIATSTQAVFQPFKPVAGSAASPKKSSPLAAKRPSQAIDVAASTRTEPLTSSSGCKVAGLSRRNTKTQPKSATTSASGLRQLDLRSMFAAKP